MALVPRAKILATQSIADFVGPKREARKRKPRPDRVRAEAEQMALTNRFEGATPSHLVGLYEHCHRQVYGVAPGELNAEVWMGAASAAGKLIRDEFGGDVRAAVEFVRWTWWREKGREETAKKRGEVRTFRIGWRLQFRARELLTDYRVEQLRRG